MPVQFSCQCGEVIRTSRRNAGRKGKCPGCGRVVWIPGPAVAPTTSQRPSRTAPVWPSSQGRYRTRPTAQAPGSPRRGRTVVIVACLIVSAAVAVWALYGRDRPENSDVSPGPSSAKHSTDSIQGLCALYEDKALDLANPRLGEDIDKVLDGLAALSGSRDTTEAAQARLMRYVLAAEFTLFIAGNEPGTGYLPSGAMELLRGVMTGYGSARNDKILLAHRTPRVVLGVLRKMGANIPHDPSLTRPAKDKKEFIRQMAVVRASFPNSWREWARQVRAIPDEQLGDLAGEKAAFESFLAAIQTDMSTPDGFRRMIVFTAEHSGSRWADDAEFVCLMMSIDIFRHSARASSLDPLVALLYDDIVDFLGVRAEYDKIAKSTGPVRPDAMAVCIQNAMTAKCKQFTERRPKSPWRPSVAMAMNSVQRLRL